MGDAVEGDRDAQFPTVPTGGCGLPRTVWLSSILGEVGWGGVKTPKNG